MPFQPTMSQPIACPPMEHSPSSLSYSSYSPSSSYSGVSDDSSMSFLDMYFMHNGHGHGTSAGTSTGPGSVADFPLNQQAFDFEPSSLDSNGAYYGFNPTFVYTPETLPIMDAPTSYPSSSTPSWSPTSMPVEQSMFPLDGLSQEPAKPAKPYSCEDCGKAFTRPADLKRHQSTVHYPVFQNCPVPDCSRKDNNGFPRRDHLVEHLRSFHHMDVPKRRAAKRLRTV
ncbi:hypothetical protein BDW74DRAFT_150924 [Aspergillus multicolor]|uniref:C2H2-type zinc finger protein n=1 Tax=Aspergillus multicolor TaxID=41759 RepID=UPI003CCE4BD8